MITPQFALLAEVTDDDGRRGTITAVGVERIGHWPDASHEVVYRLEDAQGEKWNVREGLLSENEAPTKMVSLTYHSSVRVHVDLVRGAVVKVEVPTPMSAGSMSLDYDAMDNVVPTKWEAEYAYQLVDTVWEVEPELTDG